MARLWRYFGTREIKEARAFALAGGIAVHENLFKLRGHRTCHMLAVDEAALLAAGAELGLGAAQLHRSATVHFDLVGVALSRALARCEGGAMIAAGVESDRLMLRLAGLEDVGAILRYYRENETHLAPYDPLKPAAFYTAPYWEARVRHAREEYLDDRAMRMFLFTRAAPDTVVGTVSLSAFQRGPAQSCNLGYSLAETAQGHGYMTEILPRLFAHAFGPLRLHRIQAAYMPHNVRSGKLLRRLGFVVEGYARDYLMIAGQWEDHVLTSLTNPDWAG